MATPRATSMARGQALVDFCQTLSGLICSDTYWLDGGKLVADAVVGLQGFIIKRSTPDMSQGGVMASKSPMAARATTMGNSRRRSSCFEMPRSKPCFVEAI
ncbi:hypothetical protein G3M48_001036 [Beauveria asiatica]|uniref:Uncharacterized protein n=1 Tax=Beauveria asiatica TaxID=1069075 RepID=A0AAW0S0W8_9HYPO